MFRRYGAAAATIDAAVALPMPRHVAIADAAPVFIKRDTRHADMLRHTAFAATPPLLRYAEFATRHAERR